LLAEHTRYDIYFNKNDVLNKLKKLTQIDKKDPVLFKLSLYYFTLKGDIINAEISLQNLKKLEWTRQDIITRCSIIF